MIGIWRVELYVFVVSPIFIFPNLFFVKVLSIVINLFLKSKYAQMNALVTKNEFLQETKIDTREDEVQMRLQEAQDIIDNANSQQNKAINPQNTQEQQITNQENKVAENGLSEGINNNKDNYASKYFQDGLEKFKSGKYTQDDNIVILDEIPQYLYNQGYEYNQPIVLNMEKLKNIMKEPKGTFKGVNQHGITMDIIEQLPQAISNPLNVIKNPKYNNRYVIITELTDQYGDIVIVPIEMNAKGYIENIETWREIKTILYMILIHITIIEAILLIITGSNCHQLTIILLLLTV